MTREMEMIANSDEEELVGTTIAEQELIFATVPVFFKTAQQEVSYL